MAGPAQPEGRQGYGDTFREMEKLGIRQATPCRPVDLQCQSEPGRVLYTVGPRRWSFDKEWKRGQIQKTHDFLRRAIAERKRNLCVIVGNGPSLAQTNLDLLKDQDVIISNNSFLSPNLTRLARYYTVVNYLVADQGFQHINRLSGIIKILPYWLSYCLHEGPDTYFIDAVGYPEFSKDIFKNVSWRHTVSFFNLHIAYGLGYRKVALVGFDHNYKQDPTVREGEVICSQADDVNHFHPDYFRGKKWQAADVTQMEAMYRLAKDAYESEGRVIVNATVGGHLELFPRESLDVVVKGA